jgi:hypothetical protein
MTSADLGVAILLFSATLVSVLVSWFFLQRPQWTKHQRLPLFAIRDRLIWLVAEGKLEEDDQVFQCLYRNLNAIIPIARPMRFGRIVRGLESVELTKENEETFKLMLQAIEHEDSAVRQVARDLFAVIFHILMRDVFVRLAFFRSLRQLVQVFVGHNPPIFRVRLEAYRIARRMETATEHLTLSPA